MKAAAVGSALAGIVVALVADAAYWSVPSASQLIGAATSSAAPSSAVGQRNLVVESANAAPATSGSKAPVTTRIGPYAPPCHSALVITSFRAAIAPGFGKVAVSWSAARGCAPFSVQLGGEYFAGGYRSWVRNLSGESATFVDQVPSVPANNCYVTVQYTLTLEDNAGSHPVVWANPVANVQICA